MNVLYLFVGFCLVVWLLIWTLFYYLLLKKVLNVSYCHKSLLEWEESRKDFEKSVKSLRVQSIFIVVRSTGEYRVHEHK